MSLLSMFDPKNRTGKPALTRPMPPAPAKKNREKVPPIPARESFGEDESFFNHIIALYAKYLNFNGEAIWVAVDFDETLVQSNGLGKFKMNPGPPITPIVNVVKRILKEGITVKIFTARVSFAPESLGSIREWCKKYLGQELEITNIKDAGMFCLLDDKAFNVTSKGKILHGK